MSKKTKKAAQHARERLIGWSAIARELGMSVQWFKREVLAKPEGELAAIVRKDPGTGKPFAFVDDVQSYLEDAPPYSAAG